MPIVLIYLCTIITLPKIICNINGVPKEKEFIYTMWFVMAQCCSINITKWIYCIVVRNNFQKFMIDVNQLTMKFHEVNLTKKSINNNVFIIIIITYIALNYVFNIYVQEKLWFYYLFALSLETANFEQYFIYNINKTIYLIIEYLNDSFKYNNSCRTQLIKTYDDYKRIIFLAENANKTFGFLLLCTLSFTLTTLINACYKFQMFNLEIDLMYISNMIYLAIFFVRLFFTIYNWDMLIMQVCNVVLNYKTK